MNPFKWRQLRITRDAAEERRITGRLQSSGIQTRTRSVIATNPGRHHGVPGIRSDAAYEYRIYVHKADHAKAQEVLRN